MIRSPECPLTLRELGMSKSLLTARPLSIYMPGFQNIERLGGSHEGRWMRMMMYVVMGACL